MCVNTFHKNYCYTYYFFTLFTKIIATSAASAVIIVATTIFLAASLLDGFASGVEISLVSLFSLFSPEDLLVFLLI